VALHPPCWRPSLLLPPRQESPFRAALDAAPCAFDHHVHVSVLGSSPSCSIIGRTPCRLHHLLCQIIISSIISILAEPSRCISGHASCRPSFVISFSNRHAISSIALHAVQLDLHLLVSSHHHIVSFASLDSSLTHEVVHPRPDRRPVSHHVALVRVRPARSPARCRSHVLLLNSSSTISLLHAGLHAGLTFSRIVTAVATMSRVGAGDAGAVTGSLGAPQSRASPSRCLSRLEECFRSCSHSLGLSVRSKHQTNHKHFSFFPLSAGGPHMPASRSWWGLSQPTSPPSPVSAGNALNRP
jgi:hypothetical protein